MFSCIGLIALPQILDEPKMRMHFTAKMSVWLPVSIQFWPFKICIGDMFSTILSHNFSAIAIS